MSILAYCRRTSASNLLDQQLFSDCCVPYVLICVVSAYIALHIDSAHHRHLAFCSITRPQCTQICIGGVIMHVGVKTTPPIMDSQKKEAWKFFWKEFRPFAKISRRENNPVYDIQCTWRYTTHTHTHTHTHLVALVHLTKGNYLGVVRRKWAVTHQTIVSFLYPPNLLWWLICAQLH